MKTVITLDHNSNTVVVEKEWRNTFIHEVLEAMGIPLENFWNQPILSAHEKLRLVSLLNHYEIEIYEDIDGVVEIFHKKESIAKWNKPAYVLKRDISANERDKSVYLEMTVDYWSLYHREPNDK